MARDLGILFIAVMVLASTCESAAVSPVSESHRSAALELFSPAHGSYGRLIINTLETHPLRDVFDSQILGSS